MHPIPAESDPELKKSIILYIQGKSYRPMGQTLLLKKLHLPRELHPSAKKIITELLREGAIKIVKNRIIPILSEPTRVLVEGIIRMHPRGFGFVTPSKAPPGTRDIFIPRAHSLGAVDGDTVEVETDPKKQSPKGPEGVVITIIKRGRETLAGTITEQENSTTYLAYIPILGPEKEVIVHVDPKESLGIGDRLIFKVVRWEDDHQPTLCSPLEKIGHISDASADIPAALKEYDLRSLFPKGVVDEARAFGAAISAAEKKKRTDFTSLETVTIDPTDAKDYDDAISVEKTTKGYTLYVHIADVSFYVPKNSLLDEEALARCNSTYFPGKCVPMLPEELSNELCSLKEGVERLTATVIIHFAPNGDFLSYDIVRSFIKSAKRFTYEQAKKVLDGEEKSPHLPLLERMVELCKHLKRQRYERGSIDLYLPEVRLEVGSDGIPSGFQIIEYDITHQMIEEFALKANEMVARRLIEQNKGGLFRIHEEPGPKDLDDFFALARRFGFSIGSDPSSQDIQALFEQAKQTPHIHQLSVAFIRSMKLAVYSEENVGHFGLGLEYYCHFTSPIRRYSDLIVHRLLFEGCEEDLQQVALRCSEKERLSFRAESSVTNLKKLRYLEQLSISDPGRIYTSTVSKIKPFGISFEIPPLMIEGFIHISQLGNDYFDFQSDAELLRGRRSGQIFRSGVEIQVTLQDIDLITQDTSWKIVDKSSRR